MSIDKLKAASQDQVSMYLPYIQGSSKRTLLPYAISLHQQGVVEGHRKIEGGDNIPFVITWNVASLPSDLTRCRIQFAGNAELSYEVMMTSFEYINFLIELMENYKRSRLTDFSQSFYRKLLRIDEVS
ncbi:hypothetical protein VB711_15720 [Cronbergia sp. UHCC 0137]|uniref:type IV pilus biogenesis protein EbsA n=1 Tax=Cronbergia sp. UHCC 0137 TaxID=3110239 RepID=UPI002B1FA909|nr:type IV pilus biogenesis protein EbsA [Cronbergia sp. UHCC 0137]MEA5619276.1 hypothetical protein [Cronbergia sp. UHCC 0137]